MQHTPNRWITTVGLISLLAMIGLARSAAVQASSNVVVTNATTQPVPVKVISTSATPVNTLVVNSTAQALPVKVVTTPTTPVNVNLSTHGKDALQVVLQAALGLNGAGGTVYFDSIPGERFALVGGSVYFRRSVASCVRRTYRFDTSNRYTSRAAMPIFAQGQAATDRRP